MGTKTSKKYEKDLQQNDFYANDFPTQLNKPWARVIVNGVALILLGKEFGSISNGYFSSVAIFAFPMLYDYLRFSPVDIRRRVLKRIEICLLIIVLITCTLGLLGVLGIVTIGKAPHIMVQSDFVVACGFHFPALVLWWFSAISFLISAIDVFTMKTKAEEKINEYKNTSETVQTDK